jgi:hypothetical protein
MPSNSSVYVLVGQASKRVPGLRRVPVLKLLALAELVLLARDHYELLSPGERRQLMLLLRRHHGRPANLSRRDRDELAYLIAKVRPRAFAGTAVDKLSPLPLPNRILYGPRRSRRA